jgi:hypothetical protein
VKHENRNLSGNAYALTVLTPILRGHESTLVQRLDSFAAGPASPLAKVPGTHFARWVVIDAVVYQGGRQRRDRLEVSRLLFTSNFDGPLDAYVEALRTYLGEDADRVWGQCAGYPGSDDPAAFARYLCEHQVESSLFFAAYGGLTVDQVRGNLEVRQRVMDFALSGQGMAPTELRDAFRKAFA